MTINTSKTRMQTIRQLGNSIKTRDDVDENQTKFKINSITAYIECISVMAKLVRSRQAFSVKLERLF